MKLKITGGELKGRLINAPKGNFTRPTLEKLRKTLFDICQASVLEAHVLDLFSGSGALGIEALSRGVKHVVFVEHHKIAIDTIKNNLETLNLRDQATVYPMDVFRALDKLKKLEERFDLIFIDPPYAKSIPEVSLSERVLLELDQSKLLTENARIFLEEGQHFNFERTVQSLKRFKLKSRRDAGDSQLIEWVSD